MLALLQRVTQAKVVVNHQTIAEISQGILILCGFKKEDDEHSVLSMVEKCSRYRLFSDAQNKMNLSVRDIGGGLLLVPQFTLVADTQKGLRPSFSKGASPEQGQALFDILLEKAKSIYDKTFFGQFGADMKVSLVNDGPVTFMLEN